MISFKGAQYPKDVILFVVFFYVRYGLSYRDLEGIMAERSVSVDHTTLNRWVTRYLVQSLRQHVAAKGHATVLGGWTKPTSK